MPPAKGKKPARAAAAAAAPAVAAGEKTRSRKEFESLLSRYRKDPSGGKRAATLHDRIAATEIEVRDFARTAGMSEYRAQRGASSSTDVYHLEIANLDDALTRLDALYAFRTQVCFEDVAAARAEVAAKVSETPNYVDRVKNVNLRMPPYVDETGVILQSR